MKILKKIDTVADPDNTNGCSCSLDEIEAPCCGSPTGPPSGIEEKPGYRIMNFVKEFKRIGTSWVPHVKTHLNFYDHLGSLRARLGIVRDDYKIAPGLYACGNPGADSDVCVTANYKLSFDHLRKYLKKSNTWILVLDTRGINVWCAAGKGTFGTKELINRIRNVSLASIVKHKRIIVPQLGATGVSERTVRKESGFKVIWGPVRASDLTVFLQNNYQKDARMRRVTFSLKERVVLVPVEITLLYKYTLWLLPALFIISGIGPGFFSIYGAWERGIALLFMMLSGIIGGTCVTPLFLPQLPGTYFSKKGLIAGIIMGILTLLTLSGGTGFTGAIGMLLLTGAISSHLAMNFTGSTPYTSPSGVEYEMKKSIPWQLAAALTGLIFWVVSAFL